MNMSRKTNFIVFSGLYSALAIVLYFIEIPVIPPFNYLKIDFSDIPAALAACMMGPVAGIAVEFVKNLIHVFVRGFADTMGYGDIMNFLVGCAFIVPFSAVYRFTAAKRKGIASMLLGGAAGLLSMIIVGITGNYILAPLYFSAFMHITLDSAALWAAVGSATVLNVIKPVIITFCCALVVPLLPKYFKKQPA